MRCLYQLIRSLNKKPWSPRRRRAPLLPSRRKRQIVSQTVRILEDLRFPVLVAGTTGAAALALVSGSKS